MYRPENWENPYRPEDWQINIVSHQVTKGDDSMSCAELMGRNKGYEAGADAILETLKGGCIMAIRDMEALSSAFGFVMRREYQALEACLYP